MKSLQTVLAGAALAVLTAGSAHAAVTMGTANGANYFPFGSYSGSIYQEEYNGATLGNISFDTVSFYRSGSGTTSYKATYDIKFYYTNPPMGLGTSASGNRGALIGDLGTFSISGAAPSTLSFTGAGMDYDSTLGNLMMEIDILSATVSGGASFQADSATTDIARAYQGSRGSDTMSAGGGALVTTFSTTASVPEPATWAMMLMGFGAIGFGMRNRQRKVGVSFS